MPRPVTTRSQVQALNAQRWTKCISSHTYVWQLEEQLQHAAAVATGGCQPFIKTLALFCHV
jgi:hypothetical protein